MCRNNSTKRFVRIYTHLTSTYPISGTWRTQATYHLFLVWSLFILTISKVKEFFLGSGREKDGDVGTRGFPLVRPWHGNTFIVQHSVPLLEYKFEDPPRFRRIFSSSYVSCSIITSCRSFYTVTYGRTLFCFDGDSQFRDK